MWDDEWKGGWGGDGWRGRWQSGDGGCDGKGESKKGWHGGKGKGKGKGRGKGGGEGGGAGGGISRVHVANLPKHSSEDALSEMFGSYGKVLGTKILGLRGSASCSAIVRFETTWAAEAAVAEPPKGRSSGPPLEVKLAKPNAKWEA